MDERSTGRSSSGRSSSPAVTRAASVLNLLAANPRQPFGPTELSRAVGVPKSTVLNICAAMVESGLLRRGPAGYQLGNRLAEFGNAYLKSVAEVEEFYHLCQAMLPSAPQTVQLGVLGDGLSVIYLARHDGRVPLNLGLASEIGRAVPAYCTANGKALLAALGPDELDLRLKASLPLTALTPRSIHTETALRTELDSVRERGYAIEHGEVVEGLTCFASALRTPRRNDGLLAVSFTYTDQSGPDVDQAVSELRSLVSEFATQIGGTVVRP